MRRRRAHRRLSGCRQVGERILRLARHHLSPGQCQYSSGNQIARIHVLSQQFRMYVISNLRLINNIRLTLFMTAAAGRPPPAAPSKADVTRSQTNGRHRCILLQ